MNALIPIPATITTIRKLTADTTLYTLTCKHATMEMHTENNPLVFLPGQFLQLSLPAIGEIPVSYCGFPSDNKTIELCLRHVGRVTNALKNAIHGQRVGIRGPFGTGFPLNEFPGRDLLLIAGGVGLAPIRSLLLALLNQRELWGTITLLYGARKPQALLFVDELQYYMKRRGVAIHVAVDQADKCCEVLPSCRTALLPELIDDVVLDTCITSVAICAPPLAYPALVAALKARGIPDNNIHLSLERQMRCGIGRCGHCAIGSLLCCVDGPVFSLQQLQGIEGALA